MENESEQLIVLPHHIDTAKAIVEAHFAPSVDSQLDHTDIGWLSEIIARHDPHATTLRLLENVLALYDGVAKQERPGQIMSEVRARLAAHSKPDETKEATDCEGCIHRHYVTPDPMGTSRPGWGCLLSGGHATKRCAGYTTHAMKGTQ